MGTPSRYESSPGDLSSPPSGPLSEPGSPTRREGAKKMASDEIVVNDGQDAGARPPDEIRTSDESGRRYGRYGEEWVQLTASGLPRKKPGRKPGANIKSKAEGSDQPDAKVRKPRKPRDPNAPPVQRKRKVACTDGDATSEGPSPKLVALGAPNEPSHPPSQQQTAQSHGPASASHGNSLLDHRYSPTVPKREPSAPSSMHNLLNVDPPSRPHTTGPSNGAAPSRSSGQSYDPIRDGKYDPVRESMGLSNSGSPRAQPQPTNRSPSIASIIEPPGLSLRSPPRQPHSGGYQPSKLPGHEASLPASPSQPPRSTSHALPASSRSAAAAEKDEPKKRESRDQPPAPPPLPKPVVNESNFTTIASGPVKKVSPKQTVASAPTPKTDNSVDEVMQEGDNRSILDFGRAKPGEEMATPSIVLSIPIRAGETNKYVNFMRLAEDRYGWDALHPRLAADRDRKARIAAAAASLEKVESGRESGEGDDMSVDLSDAEASNPENGGGASGADGAQTKPAKKKRNFKEDNYDVDDDFVDDSELMWEAQAAASRDGFFVYSGPLVPEVEKPAGQEAAPKRGRGSRGGRGGSRASTRGGATATGGGRNGGGPGSRGGGAPKKPRVTKSEKAQREREKAEKETMAQLGRSNGLTTPSLSVTELGA
ncbi:Pfam:HPC2 [Geosmithia morbida]|uniref:Pfam:HPC2 n=1 Tax=Geosmithia morbida TaxID=1094350 RepID=A0A9P5D0E2_9HYPO|nr:Pfam:HPC2 [Geosmithia morbida]KAF4121517.1 Pfam:HPC2 [Geosmithia morbida]